MSNQVQAMTIAMFGAAAGGYTAELEASVAASGVAAVANSIMGLQQPLLGIDLSDDAVWTDFVLANLGITDTNAAYGTAAAYFADRFEAGASRGDIVAEAVAYLGGTVSAEFTAIAEAFVAQVETAEEWSVGDGATALGIADLREALGNDPVPGVFNLTAALATLAAAEEAEAAALAAVATEDAGNDVTAGAELAEEQDLADFVEGYFGEDADVELSAAETAALDADDDHQTAISTLALARVDASDAELAAAVVDAQDDIDAVDGLQEEIDAYDAALVAQEAADGVELTAQANLAAAIAFVNVQNEVSVDAEVLAGDMAIWIDTNNDDAVTEGETVLVGWDAEAEAYVAAGDLTNEDYAGLTDLVAKANAFYAADAASDDADQDVTDAETALGEDGFVLYDALADAQGAVDVRDDLIEAVADAATDLAAAEAYATELGELVGAYVSAGDATEDAAFAIDEAGFVLQSTTTSSVDLDVYTVDSADADDIEDFAVGDVISVSGFTLNSGDVEADGNNNVLEYFLTETEAGLDVTFETAVFGSNAADPEVVTITLTGVSLEDVSVGSAYIVGL